jgi:hypothetical protein
MQLLHRVLIYKLHVWKIPCMTIHTATQIKPQQQRAPRGLLSTWFGRKPANTAQHTAPSVVNRKDAYCMDRATD